MQHESSTTNTENGYSLVLQKIEDDPTIPDRM